MSRGRWLSVARALNVIVGVVVVAGQSTYSLRPGEAGIIFRKFCGSRKEAVQEGTYFLIPWIDEIRVVNMIGRPQTITLQCFLHQLQSVTVTVTILYRPDVTAVVEMTKKLGFDYYTMMMRSITFEKVQDIISQSTPKELSNNLSVISQSIFVILAERAKEGGIILEDFSIVEFKFRTEFCDMVEEYHVREQQNHLLAEASARKAEQADLCSESQKGRDERNWLLRFLNP